MDSVPVWKPPVDAPCSRTAAPKGASGSRRVSRASKASRLSDERLDYSKRLHHRREFLQFFSGSEVFRFRNVVVFRKKTELGHFRLGVTFKARMSSVERNAIRRRIREAMRQLSPQLGSYDFNVVVQKVERPARVFARTLAAELKSGLISQRPVPAKNKPRGGPAA
jgi:ribonuclease P protein component